MNRLSFILIWSSALILTAGCNKQEDRTAPPATPQSQSTAPQSPPATPTAPMPAPDAPKDQASAGPKPGQANDHSNPDFKAGEKGVQK